MNKKILLFAFILFAVESYSQINNKFWIYGKVIDSSGVVKNVNVLNLTSKKGTFTNDFGDYKMVVSLGDTLKFTSVQHDEIVRVVNNLIYTSERLDVYMANKTYVLFFI